jgi:hypothetical protein
MSNGSQKVRDMISNSNRKFELHIQIESQQVSTITEAEGVEKHSFKRRRKSEDRSWHLKNRQLKRY